MVYENTYNYYLFFPPDNIKEFSFYLTVLSGQAELISSQHFYNPEKIFINLRNNDIRLAPHKTIHYSA